MKKLKIVLIGAGSAQFGYGILGDVFQSALLQMCTADIVLHDINPHTMEMVRHTAQTYVDEHALPFTVTATTDRKAALRGADFCIISIEVGDRFELWEQDWRVPQQFGIRQVYGENGGPGGFFHSLRIIPPILEICADIAEICPRAFIFNFSNPMSRICTAVNLKYPKLKFIGLCHEISSLQQHLPSILSIDIEQLDFVAGGLNHFSVLLKAVYKSDGGDAYPEILAKAHDYFDSHKHALPAPHEHNSDFEGKRYGTGAWHERGLFRYILETYKLLPITTDSHFGEYIPWAYEVVHHEGIQDFYNSYKEYVHKSSPRILPYCTERVVPIIEGIIEDVNYVEHAVNIPNDGLIEDLPDYLAVEVPAHVREEGIFGIAIGDLIPPGFMALLQNQAAIHKLTAEAVIRKSREIALHGLLADPIVEKANPMEQLLDYMLELQSDYLSYLK